VRSQYSAAARPSRRLYPPAQEVFLQNARQQVCVLELEGALFFGNADGLAAQVGRLDQTCRFIVLDLKRISTLDASGAVALSQIAARLKRLGRTVLLAGVTPENRHGRTLHAAGVAATLQPDCFADADHAVEAAEHRLLAEARLDVADADVALDECSLLQGMDQAQRERVRALLEPRELAAREVLFRQGDAGDRLYVLTRGSVTVSSAAGEGRLLQRYVSFSPGMMLGETAMFDGAGRTADAIADVPSTVFALTRTALAQLLAEHPAVAATLMTNIARHLSERLRHAAAAWRLAAA
jgi:anti-anti-sigma regulatory factor